MTLELVQGTDAWRAIRAGKVTASRASDVIVKVKNGDWGAGRKNYKADLVLERLTGKPRPHFTTKAMQDGTLREPDAKAQYECLFGVDVVNVGFVLHPTIDMAGCSPDGLVEKDGLVEIKCPEPAQHMATLKGAAVDGDYIKQIAWQFACQPKRKWCDFISFNPEFPAEMQLFCKRLLRKDKDVADIIAELEREVPIFLAEVAKDVADLKARYSLKEAA